MKAQIQRQSKLMEELLAQESVAMPELGDVAEGTVIGMGKNEVYIDIDGFATGIVRGRELFDESGEYSDIEIGKRVAATVLELENENGQLELSFLQAGHMKAWQKLTDLREAGTIVDVKVTSANKGGLLVRLGQIDGFLPVSQLTVEHYPRVEGGDKNKILEKLQALVGQLLKVKVLDATEQEDKLIVSEKAAYAEQHRKTIEGYKVNDVIDGRITAVTDFGAFVEFDSNLEGLVHISEIAWQRIENPRDVVRVGDQIKAQIIKIEDGKIFLSMKKLKEDPWSHIYDKYRVGQVVQGKIIKANPFGFFVELDKEIHGLAHISELSDQPVTDPLTVASIGDIRDFLIVSIRPREHRLGLSIKALARRTRAQDESGEGKAGEETEKKEGASHDNDGDKAKKGEGGRPASAKPTAGEEKAEGDGNGDNDKPTAENGEPTADSSAAAGIQHAESVVASGGDNAGETANANAETEPAAGDDTGSGEKPEAKPAAQDESAESKE